jgi:hypothetical protein
MADGSKRCSVEGCERAAEKRGWCSTHYKRWQKHGEPGPAGSLFTPKVGICSIEGCDRPVQAKGWCSGHHHRWHRYGDPTAGGPMRTISRLRDPVARFWEAADCSGGLDTCWPWTKGVSSQGYGQFTSADARKVLAHRVAYELAYGPIPDGLTVDHRCHDPAVCGLGADCPHRRCVNPAHLEAVTMVVNVMRGSGVGATNAAKTHCIHGHEFTPENTYIRKGNRHCIKCRRRRERERATM